MMTISEVLILGSTGSIGVNTLDVVSRHPDRFRVFGLVAGKNIDLLLAQAIAHRPQAIVICDNEALNRWHSEGFSQRLAAEYSGTRPLVLDSNALDALCADDRVNTVVAAIVGAAGLKPTLAAIRAGKQVLLANKESLVLGGRFMMEAAARSGAQLLPVDSEHNAIFQCLPQQTGSRNFAYLGVQRLILTASGGPFRYTPVEQLSHVTPEQAVAHPNWVMGKKISVDSATMANKGLELIEALWLFGLPASQLSVLIHPQSIVHSLVEYVDGSMLAQLGSPDMRTPIAHVLGFPDRIESGSPRLNLAEIAKLEFLEPDLERYPMLALMTQVLERPDVLGPIYNAANEVAVERFLDGKLKYLQIPQLVGLCLERFGDEMVDSLSSALELDAAVRQAAHGIRF